MCAGDDALVSTVSVIGEEGVASPRRNPPAACSLKRACVRHQSGDTTVVTVISINSCSCRCRYYVAWAAQSGNDIVRALVLLGYVMFFVALASTKSFSRRHLCQSLFMGLQIVPQSYWSSSLLSSGPSRFLSNICHAYIDASTPLKSSE